MSDALTGLGESLASAYHHRLDEWSAQPLSLTAFDLPGSFDLADDILRIEEGSQSFAGLVSLSQADLVPLDLVPDSRIIDETSQAEPQPASERRISNERPYPFPAEELRSSGKIPADIHYGSRQSSPQRLTPPEIAERDANSYWGMGESGEGSVSPTSSVNAAGQFEHRPFSTGNTESEDFATRTTHPWLQDEANAEPATSFLSEGKLSQDEARVKSESAPLPDGKLPQGDSTSKPATSSLPASRLPQDVANPKSASSSRQSELLQDEATHIASTFLRPEAELPQQRPAMAFDHPLAAEASTGEVANEKKYSDSIWGQKLGSLGDFSSGLSQSSSVKNESPELPQPARMILPPAERLNRNALAPTPHADMHSRPANRIYSPEPLIADPRITGAELHQDAAIMKAQTPHVPTIPTGMENVYFSPDAQQTTPSPDQDELLEALTERILRDFHRYYP